MDPGESHLERLKAVPNLVEEDPSIITPASQKNYMNMSWKDFSAMLKSKQASAEKMAKQRTPPPEYNSQSSTVSSVTTPERDRSTPAVFEDEPEGYWDAGTGYQDEDHTPCSNNHR